MPIVLKPKIPRATPPLTKSWRTVKLNIAKNRENIM